MQLQRTQKNKRRLLGMGHYLSGNIRLQKAIEQNGFNVLLVQDESECLTALEQENPDSTIDGYITNWDTSNPDDLNCLKLEIHNPQPSVFYYVYFDINCIGSIPVHFTNWEIDTNLPYDCYQYEVHLDYITNSEGETIIDEPIPINEIQLHEGETAYFVIWFYFYDCIDTQTTYDFYIHTMEYQFNLEPSG